MYNNRLITEYWWNPSLSIWRETFIILPKTTITGQRIWLTRCYTRRMSVHSLAHIEPINQYAADLFEILRIPQEHD